VRLPSGEHHAEEGIAMVVDRVERLEATSVMTWSCSRPLLTDRRTLLGVLVASGLLIIHHPRRIMAQEATPDALVRVSGETFVGETSDPETLVAIVVEEGTDGESRPARGYLCNGLARTIDVWLTGELTGEQLTLGAEDGSQLSGVQNAAGIGGGATLGDGTSLLFTALPATGIAGLYTVEMLVDGTMLGSAASGGQLTGTLQDQGTPAGERFAYAVTLTPPTQDAVPLSMTIRTATTEEGEFRVIFLPDGQGRGQGKTKKGRNWTDPDTQP
jgi:hypothetical protein